MGNAPVSLESAARVVLVEDAKRTVAQLIYRIGLAPSTLARSRKGAHASDGRGAPCGATADAGAEGPPGAAMRDVGACADEADWRKAFSSRERALVSSTARL